MLISQSTSKGEDETHTLRKEEVKREQLSLV